MACQAITKDLRCCRNWSTLDSDLCHMHKDLSAAILKKRWFNKYILGLDGEMYYLNYFSPGTKTRGNTIRQALTSGKIKLTKEDISCIPHQIARLDIYVLLCEIGACQPQDNVGLYKTTLRYRFTHSEMIPLAVRELIDKTLILASTEVFEFFLLQAPQLFKMAHPWHLPLTGIFHNIVAFVNKNLEHPIVKAYSWVPHREYIHKEVLRILGNDHPLSIYYQSRVLPDLQELYNTEKQIQKAKMFYLQEDLMAATWHPDRFQQWCLDEEEKKEEMIEFA